MEWGCEYGAYSRGGRGPSQHSLDDVIVVIELLEEHDLAKRPLHQHHRGF
jgi:hypothetical protein